MRENVSEHFYVHEVECRCGCGQCIKNDKLLQMVENFRAYLNETFSEKLGHEIGITPHSVNRCKKHNDSVGGASDSLHLIGQAMDLHVNGLPKKKLHKLAKKLWSDKNILYGGLGLYNYGIHIDVGEYRFWDKS